MSAARQWSIKCAVVFVVVGVLALALPALLGVIKPSIEPMRLNGMFAGTVFVGAAVSLYVSSLSSSGVKALLIAVPAGFTTLPLFRAIEAAAYAIVGSAQAGTGRVNLPSSYDPRVLALEAAVSMTLFLRFALINHRSIDRDARRVAPGRPDCWVHGAERRRLHGRADVGAPTVTLSPAHNRPLSDV